MSRLVSFSKSIAAQSFGGANRRYPKIATFATSVIILFLTQAADITHMIIVSTVVSLSEHVVMFVLPLPPPLITDDWMCVWIRTVVVVGLRRGKDVCTW